MDKIYPAELNIHTSEVTYKCRKCRDTQFVEARDNRVKQCDCLLAEIEAYKARKLIKGAQMENYKDMTFEAFKPRSDEQKAAYEAISANHRGYLLYGPPGCGKTHLLAASVSRALSQDIPAVIISAPRLLDEIRKAGRENKTDIEESARRIRYLVIDDIGKEKSTDWVMERLFVLIDERWKAWRAGRQHTSFSTNNALYSQSNGSGLEDRLDPATFDRIRGMTEHYFVKGPSGR